MLQHKKKKMVVVLVKMAINQRERMQEYFCLFVYFMLELS